MSVEVTDSGRKTSKSAATCVFGIGVGLLLCPCKRVVVSTAAMGSLRAHSEHEHCSKLGSAAS